MNNEASVALLLASEVNSEQTTEVQNWCGLLVEMCGQIIAETPPESWRDWADERSREWSGTLAENLDRNLRTDPLLSSSSSLREAATELLNYDLTALQNNYVRHAAIREAAKVARRDAAKAEPVFYSADGRAYIVKVDTAGHEYSQWVDATTSSTSPESDATAHAGADAVEATRAGVVAAKPEAQAQKALTSFAAEVLQKLHDEDPALFKSIPLPQLSKLTVDAVLESRRSGATHEESARQ